MVLFPVLLIILAACALIAFIIEKTHSVDEWGIILLLILYLMYHLNCNIILFPKERNAL